MADLRLSCQSVEPAILETPVAKDHFISRRIDSQGDEALEQLLEVLGRKIGVSGNGAHGLGVDWSVTRDNKTCNAVRHYNMLALPRDLIAESLKDPNGLIGADSGDLGHVRPSPLPR